jgi:hypothetical protein
MARSGRAIEVGIEYLQESGVEWPLPPTDEDVNKEYQRIRQQLGMRPIGALLDSPLMPDPNQRARMDVLTQMLAPAIPRDLNLRDLFSSAWQASASSMATATPPAKPTAC